MPFRRVYVVWGDSLVVTPFVQVGTCKQGISFCQDGCSLHRAVFRAKSPLHRCGLTGPLNLQHQAGVSRPYMCTASHGPVFLIAGQAFSPVSLTGSLHARVFTIFRSQLYLGEVTGGVLFHNHNICSLSLYHYYYFTMYSLLLPFYLKYHVFYY